MIVLIADLHLHNHNQYSSIDEDGTNTRLLDIINYIKKIAVDTKDKADTLIIAGDVFHSRKSIDDTVLHRVCLLFQELSLCYKRIVILAGNHDMSITGDGSLSITAFQGIKNIEIIDKRTTLEIDGMCFGFIPYTEDLEKVKTDVNYCVKKKSYYLIAHLGILGGKVGPSDFEVPGKFAPEVLKAIKFHHVFLGHFHKHQDVDENITYIGSPLQLNWGERNEKKGYYLIEKSKYKFIENKTSPHFILIEDNKPEEICEIDFVKVVTSNEDEAHTWEESLENVRFSQVEIHKKASIRSRLDLIGKGDKDILKEYVKNYPPDISEDIDSELFIKELVKAGVSFLNNIS